MQTRSCITSLATLFIFFSLHVIAYAQNPNSKLPTLLINEINIGNQQSDDIYIELVVTNIDEIAHNVENNIPKTIIDDSNEGSTFKSGFLSIKDSCLEGVNPGDIIIIHGRSVDVSGVADNVILFNLQDDCIEKWTGVPNSQNPTYQGGSPNTNPDTRLADYINFDTPQNKFQVRTNEVYFNKVDQQGFSNYSLGTSNLNQYTPLPKSLGKPNSPANATMIANLISQAPLRINCELVADNRAIIEIIPGDPFPLQNVSDDQDYTGPYTLETPTYTEDGITSNYLSAFGLQCGENILKITDIHGRIAECSIKVDLEDEIAIEVCGQTPVDISTLLCATINSDCISFKNGDSEAVTVEKIEDIPSITPTQDGTEIGVKFSGRNGRIIHEVLITVNVITPGSDCDDGDVCTENDKYDDLCNCIGEPAEEVELTFDLIGPCQGNLHTLTATENFERYEWYLEGKTLNEKGHQIRVEYPGTYLVAAVNEAGCFFTREFYVSANFTATTLDISSTGEIICNEQDEITLSIPEGYTSVVWTDGHGTAINISSNTVTVKQAGKYIVSIEDQFGCKKNGTITVKSQIGNTEITPQYPTLCNEADQVELAVEYTDGNLYTWSTGEVANSIITNSPGEYLVTITSPQNCIATSSVNVKLRDDLDIEKVLLENGFFKERVLIKSITTVKGGEQSTSRSDQCDINSEQSQSYDIVRVGDPEQEELNLEEWIKLKVNTYRCSTPETEGILVDNFCPETQDGITLSEFVSEDENYVFKYYINESEVDSETYLYYRTPITQLTGTGTVNPPSPWFKETFKELLYDIVCSKTKGIDLQLRDNYGQMISLLGNPLKFFSSGITLPVIEQDKLTFNTVIRGPEYWKHEGIIISNLQPEGVLLTSTPSNFILQKTDQAIVTLEDFASSHKLERSFYEIKIPYDPNSITLEFDGQCSTTCTTEQEQYIEEQYYLTIYIPLEDYDSDTDNQANNDKFNGFFNNSGQLSSIALFDDDRPYSLSDLPLCMYSQEDICRLFTQNYLELDDALSVANKKLSNADITYSTDIINCFEENSLVSTYANRDNSVFGGNETNLYRHLSRHWFSLQAPTAIQVKDSEKTLALHEVELSFNIETNISYNITPDIDDFFLGKGIATLESINYFDSDPTTEKREGIMLHPAKQYDYLNQVSTLPTKDGKVGNVKVPGIYVAYAVNAANKKSAEKVLNNVLDVAGLFLAYGEIRLLYRTKRLSTAAGMLAIAEVPLGFTSLALTNSDDYCYEGDTDLCENLRRFHRTAQILLLTGSITNSLRTSINNVQNGYGNLTQAKKDELLNRLDELDAGTNKKTKEAFLSLMNLDLDLLAKLTEKYQDIFKAANNNDQIFRDLIDVIAEKDIHKLFELETAIKNLDINSSTPGVNGLKFFNDLKKTAKTPGFIGKEVGSATEGWLKAWRILDDVGASQLGTKIDDIKIVDDVLKNYPNITLENLTNYINRSGGFDTWKLYNSIVVRIGNDIFNAVETPLVDIRKLHGAPKKSRPPNFLDDLADEIQSNGYDLSKSPPIEGVRMSDGQILIFDGHHRIAALEILGETNLPINITDFTEIPEAGMRLMLKIGEESGFYLPFQYPVGYSIPDLGPALNIDIDLQAINFLEDNF